MKPPLTRPSAVILLTAIGIGTILSHRHSNSSSLFLPRLRRLFPRQNTSCPSDAPLPLRIGILGASTIAVHAIITPSTYLDDPCSISVAGIASRDVQRAARYAKKHGIQRVFRTYEELMDSEDIDAVYIGLPTVYHYRYALRAIQAGKHVLLEKPATVSYAQAMELETEAKDKGVVLLEAFHYKFHPLFQRIQQLIIEEGVIGNVEEYTVLISMPSLGGLWRRLFGLGTKKEDSTTTATATTSHEHLKMFDRWSYGLDAIMTLLAGDQVNVTVRNATLSSSVADIALGVQMTKADDDNGTTKHDASAYILATKEQLGLNWDLTIQGERGRIVVANFWFPSIYHSLTITRYDGEGSNVNYNNSFRVETVYGEGETTFECQLRHFIQLCSKEKSKREESVSSPPAIGTESMKVVDAIFEKASVYDLALQ